MFPTVDLRIIHGQMAVTFTDKEINDLINERKSLPFQWKLNLREKRGHREQSADASGDSGHEFQIILRQSKTNVLDFSVILAVKVPGSNRLFRLRRYNGKSHEHTNNIEMCKFYDFHIHQATERYQDAGGREDGFAEVTDRYVDLRGALLCLLEDAGFQQNSTVQTALI